MQLNELIIQRNTYTFEHQGIRAGGIGGRIAFSDANKHEVRLQLSPAHIDRILAIVAESMVDTTRELATTLTTSVIEHAAMVPAIGLQAA
jgi:hypothetical protein